MASEPPTIDVAVPDDGLLLLPGILYLASTVEYTETLVHVPYLDGRSSVGRLGVSIHVTAGRGDVGFKNHWTMEIWVVQPVRVYAGVKIGQLTYHTVDGDVHRGYAIKPDTTYGALARDPLPQSSRLWMKLHKSTNHDGGNDR
jgi:dCTP deaminase